VRCGLGGKVNTNPGRQNARFKGSKICASRMIRSGEEIFIPYSVIGRASRLGMELWMRKEVDGGYGESAFIEIWVERITPMMRRLARPYFRVGIILSVCLSRAPPRGGEERRYFTNVS
jgi:hypothetical protein